MNQSHSFEKCFKLLDIDTRNESSLDDVKKSYRKLIQKWHPDRYKNDDEKEIATNKLKDLNTAYKQLSTYFRKHGALPQLTPPPVIHKESTTTYRKTQTDSNKQNLYKGKNRKIPLVIVLSIFITFVLSFVYMETITSPTPKEPANYQSKDSNNKFKNSEKTNTKNTNKTKKKNNIPRYNYFTEGSSIGAVILIQGPPDKMLNDIWYYGKSEVHFKNGKVSYWIRTPNTPLKAQIFSSSRKKKTQ